MDPRYRFTIVVSSLMVAWWGYVVLSTYLFGARGLNTERYQDGILLVGGATLAGFLLVWAATRLVVWQRARQTGFEAGAVDEFGTVFEMAGADGSSHPYMMSLSKFLPQLVAPPSWPGLSELEAELIGFLNAYRHWPVDLEHPGTTIYEKAMARWQVMRHLPGSGPMHRAAALAKDLALVHAYKEVRTVFPLYEFWKRDKVRFVRRCAPHGGITALVLSTMPALRAMKGNVEEMATQRAFLTAMRYHETPAMLPVNAGPLARDIVDALWRAETQLKQLDVEELDVMSPAMLAQLRKQIEDMWQTALTDVPVNGEFGIASPAVKTTSGGTVWIQLEALLRALGPLLAPELRQALQLWEFGGGTQHPAWVHIAPMLQDMGLIASSHEEMAASNGCFNIRSQGEVMAPVVKPIFDPANKHLSMPKSWSKVEGYSGPVEVVADLPQLGIMAEAKVREMDERLAVVLGS